MKPIVLSDILAVGEVPSPEQIEILAKAGFKSILNNQRDGEVDRFPNSATFAGEAAKHGVGYAYAPIASRTPTPEELLAFARALDRLSAPIYAFCYSGARSAAATAFVLTRERNPDAIIAEFEAAGFPIEALRPWLNDQRELHAPGAIAVETAEKAKNAGQPATALPAATAAIVAPAPKATPSPVAPAGIIVHARPRGASGFAMVNTYVR